ncbi:MAG TPA: MCE family protein [Mycobacteriales bacterium]|jgi:virulence factor Mce-like protein|nr:MCE family protein [Mycobacteriales bacterium]
MSGFWGGRAGVAISGLLFLVIVAGLSVVGVAYGFGVFSTSSAVTATLPEAGPALGPGSEVEYRGVLVGSLGSIHRTLRNAVLTLRIDPSQLSKIPAGVTVRLVPRSVFGDLYVDLVPPAHLAGPPQSNVHLETGAHLVADTSTPTVELDQALDAGYQLLTAVQPEKLSATLTAIASALNGRGAELGDLIDQLEHYTTKVAPHTGELIHDIATLGTVGDELSRDAPDLLQTLDNAIATSRTVHGSQAQITKLLAEGPGVAASTRRLLAVNQHKVHELVHLLHPVVAVLKGNQANLVRAVKQLRLFLLGAARALGHGPWLQVNVEPDVNPLDSQGYTAVECPRYAGVPGTNCPGATAASRAASSAAVRAASDALAHFSITKLILAPLLAALSLVVNP